MPRPPGRAPAQVRYWRYPLAAVTLLAVAAANFALGRQSAFDEQRATPAPGADQLRFGFEGSVAPWTPAWNAGNLRADVDSGLADTGHSSLRLRVAPRPGAAPAIGTSDVAGLHPGSTVTVRVYYDGQGSGQLRPYAQDADGGIDWSTTAPLSLSGHGWTTYRWQVPDVAVQRIGFELDSAGTSLVIAVDTIAW